MTWRSIKKICSYTSDTETSGDLLTSYTATRPWYISFPSLNDNAKRSPEASHANFSMPRLDEALKPLICESKAVTMDELPKYMGNNTSLGYNNGWTSWIQSILNENMCSAVVCMHLLDNKLLSFLVILQTYPIYIKTGFWARWVDSLHTWEINY